MNLLKPDVYDMFLHVLSIWASVATCMQMLMERVDLCITCPCLYSIFFGYLGNSALQPRADGRRRHQKSMLHSCVILCNLISLMLWDHGRSEMGSCCPRRCAEWFVQDLFSKGELVSFVYVMHGFHNLRPAWLQCAPP